MLDVDAVLTGTKKCIKWDHHAQEAGSVNLMQKNG